MFKTMHNQNNSKISSSQKFLAKHVSSSSFLFFNCCRDAYVDQFQGKISASEIPQPKVSIKQLKKMREQSFLLQESQSRSKSKHTKTSNKTSIQRLKRKDRNENHQKQKTSIQLDQKTQKDWQNNKNIGYKENDKKLNAAINNFNTTNYVVGQCLVQPQETNIIFEDSEQVNATIEDEFNSIFDSNHENHLMRQFDHERKNKKKIDKRGGENNLTQQLRSYANFSFGQRQKQQFFSKYLNKITTNMKQSSNCLSQKSKAQQKKLFEMYEIDSTIQQELNKLDGEQRTRFLRETLQRKSLNYLVNKVGKTIFKSESQHTQSKESMVIDTHKSIIQKFHNPKQIHLVS